VTAALIDWDEGVAHPESIVREILQYTIQHAIEKAREKNQEPDRLIILVNSVQIETPIAVHVQQLNENSVDTVLSRFEIVDQSARLKGRGSLYGYPFTVDVTAISHHLLRKYNKEQQQQEQQPQKKKGRGRKIRPILHNINQKSLFFINNEDNLCLFRAINILRARAIFDLKEFQIYNVNHEEQLKDIMDLLNTLNIPNN
jgi:hypothetical protein